MARVEQSENLTLRIFKRALGNPDFEWVNTYEIVMPAPDNSLVGLAVMAQDIAEAEAAFHSTQVEYTRAVVSTWFPDNPDREYDPLSFLIVEFGAGELLGASSVANPLPRNAVLSCRRQVAVGRSGRLFYRGVLGEGDVTAATSLDWRLETAAKTALNLSMATFLAAFNSATGAYGGGLMALISEVDTSVEASGVLWRTVTGLEASKPAVRSTDHKYFDRA